MNLSIKWLCDFRLDHWLLSLYYRSLYCVDYVDSSHCISPIRNSNTDHSGQPLRYWRIFQSSIFPWKVLRLDLFKTTSDQCHRFIIVILNYLYVSVSVFGYVHMRALCYFLVHVPYDIVWSKTPLQKSGKRKCYRNKSSRRFCEHLCTE